MSELSNAGLTAFERLRLDGFGYLSTDVLDVG